MPLQSVFSVIPLHLQAKWIIEHITIAQYDIIHQLRHLIANAKCVFIYTDGSMPYTDRLDQGLAFALVIFFECQNGQYQTLGFLAAQLRHCGALFRVNYADSTLTEFAGIIFARLWIAIVAPPCPTHIYSDSLGAINISCNFHSPGKYRDLVNFAHSIGSFVANSIQHCPTHTLMHVKGHFDHSWNELVDSLAKATALADFSPAPCT